MRQFDKEHRDDPITVTLPRGEWGSYVRGHAVPGLPEGEMLIAVRKVLSNHEWSVINQKWNSRYVKADVKTVPACGDDVVTLDFDEPRQPAFFPVERIHEGDWPTPVCLPCWRQPPPDGLGHIDDNPPRTGDHPNAYCFLCGRRTNQGIYVNSTDLQDD